MCIRDSAYIVGSGLDSLAAACFLVRDGPMPGKNITILEAMDIAGGACDGIFDPSRGYVMRGEMCIRDRKFNFNKAVFPGIQGGPLMHVIAAKAVCFKEALQPERCV